MTNRRNCWCVVPVYASYQSLSLLRCQSLSLFIHKSVEVFDHGLRLVSIFQRNQLFWKDLFSSLYLPQLVFWFINFSLEHRCRSKHFLWVRRILPEFSQTCLKCFVWLLSANFLPQISWRPFFVMIFWCVFFLQTLGAFSENKQRWSPFSPEF